MAADTLSPADTAGAGTDVQSDQLPPPVPMSPAPQLGILCLTSCCALPRRWAAAACEGGGATLSWWALGRDPTPFLLEPCRPPLELALMESRPAGYVSVAMNSSGV